MAESAHPQPPVPKPRRSQATPTATPTITPELDSDRPSSTNDTSPDPLPSDPPPYSSLLSPSPTQHTDSDSDVLDSQVVLCKKKQQAPPILQEATPNSQDDDDYENIDALLDQEGQESIRRSDYINWVYMDEEGDEAQSPRGAVRLSHDRYAPSIKLDRHPALKKSQSNSDIPAANAAMDFIDGLRKRPRNRAPPPPPGVKPKDKGRPPTAPLATNGSSRHKRSQSDLHLCGHAQSESDPPGGQRSNAAKSQGQQSSAQKRGVVNQTSRPPFQRSPDNNRRTDKVYDQVPFGVKGRTSPKPKRHAPPPPSRKGAGAEGTPEYASVNKQKSRDQSDPVSKRWSKTDSSASGDSVGPPKPQRTRRAQSIEDLSKLTTQTSTTERPGAETRRMSVLDSMDVITLDLRKDSAASFGLVIVSGKVRSGEEEDSLLEGVFVQKVVPQSPADKDGRIQPGDMLLEVGGRDTVGGALEDTIDLLKEANESIRLRIARPDVTASVFAVEGDEEQPIYENEMLPPTELLLKLHQAESRLLEVEVEKDEALSQVLAVREQAEREKAELQSQLEEMRRQLEEGRSETEARTGELTQALASVTIGRTKAEGELETLRAEVKYLKEQLRSTGDHDHQIEQLRKDNSELSKELQKQQEMNTELEEKLENAESAHKKEVVKLQAKIASQEDQIASLKSDLEQLRYTRATPLRTHDPAPLDCTYVKGVANGHHDDGLSDELCESDDDAFDDREPSPVTPSPYLDFVPLEEKGRKGRKNQKPEETTSSEDKVVDEQVVQTTEPEREEGLERETSTEPVDLAAAATAEFDSMEITTIPLNSTAALHKTQVGRKLPRKKPSREHLRTMGSSSNLLLDTLPEDTSGGARPSSEHAQTSQNGTTQSSEHAQTSQNAGNVPSTSSEHAHNPEDGVSTTSTTATQEVTAPQPKPRPRPRVRQVPLIDEKRPTVAPRHKEVDSREQSPSYEAKKPLPKPAHKPTETSQVHNSPLLKKKELLLPSPKASPKHAAKVPKMPPVAVKEIKPQVDGTEHSTPPELPSKENKPSVEESRPTTNGHSEDNLPPKPDSPVKEKPLGSPIKIKLPPPPVPKKPKDHPHEDEPMSPTRTRSFDKEVESSPRHKRKLPAGAVNIMGFLPVQPRQEEEMRDRSATVSTSEPGAREGNTLKRQIEQHETSPLHQAHVPQEPHPPEPAKKVPPKRPPPPKKAIANQVDGAASSDEIDSDASPMLSAKVDHSGLDYSQVLSWSPDSVGEWIVKVGLSKYQRVFVERSVHGHMLFDIDGHSLKGMGMEAHDDRAIFKREVKNIKLFADKQKKALERLKKEEKKNARKKKK